MSHPSSLSSSIDHHDEISFMTEHSHQVGVGVLENSAMLDKLVATRQPQMPGLDFARCRHGPDL